jgi:hypothetical protein
LTSEPEAAAELERFGVLYRCEPFIRGRSWLASNARSPLLLRGDQRTLRADVSALTARKEDPHFAKKLV